MTEDDTVPEADVADYGMIRDLYDRANKEREELATLIRMLCRHVPKDRSIREKALDYLRRHNLQGWPLRSVPGSSAPPPREGGETDSAEQEADRA